MSFILAIIEYKIAIIFYSLVFLIVYLNRKKFDVHGKFIYLYKTKIGINFMNWVSKKATRAVKFIGYAAVAVGFIGMIFTLFMILSLAYNLILNKPGAGGASPVIPGLPIAGTGLVFPLITGWIVLFIIILVHEFSHGIVASAHKIKVKNSGMAFFGPILGAFVEPDEKMLSKQKDLVQHSVFAAGPFSNFLTAIAAVLILIFLLGPIANSFYDSNGIIINTEPGFPADKSGIKNGTLIVGINEESVYNIEDLQRIMKDIGPGTEVKFKSNESTYFVTTTENPKNPSKAYLGVYILGSKLEMKKDTPQNKIFLNILNWFIELFGWLYFLSLNIGLINLLPVFITDGARMLKVFFSRIIKDKEKSMSAWLFFNWVSLFSIVILVFLPFFRWLGSVLISLLA